MASIMSRVAHKVSMSTVFQKTETEEEEEIHQKGGMRGSWTVGANRELGTVA